MAMELLKSLSVIVLKIVVLSVWMAICLALDVLMVISGALAVGCAIFLLLGLITWEQEPLYGWPNRWGDPLKMLWIGPLLGLLIFASWRLGEKMDGTSGVDFSSRYSLEKIRGTGPWFPKYRTVLRRKFFLLRWWGRFNRWL
jgi:hypothetical protein